MQRTTTKGHIGSLLTMRKSEKGMTQNARAMLKLEARLTRSELRRRVCRRPLSKIEKTFPPKNQNRNKESEEHENPAKR